MIFYKLPTIAKKIQRLYGRLKTLTKLASYKSRYIIQILDVEERISCLKQLLQKREKDNSPQKDTQKVWNQQEYLKFLEKEMIINLARVNIKLILSEIIDDSLSMLTNKGLIQRNLDGWYVDLRNGISAKIKYMDVAIESLTTQKIVSYSE
ncbi:MAG: hypothetical protein AAFQ91_29415 [Cyanobacteria bacterium J06621_15]